MLLTNVFSNMFDDMTTERNLMNSDVQEFEDHIELDVELPGYKKSDIRAELKDGTLTIRAERHQEKDEKEHGRLIRSERFTGECRRSFYVGDKVRYEDISAAYQDGVLQLTIRKPVPAVETNEMKYIDIQ